MDSFSISRTRLPKPRDRAWTLMQLLSILETNDSIVDFREFFFSSSSRMDPEEFPDHDILGASRYDLLELFAQIEAVSFGERLRTSRPFQFHPLWLECTRHAMGLAGRLRYIRQVLLFCYRSIIADINDDTLEKTIGNLVPHVRHGLRVCEAFGIEPLELGLPETILDWARSRDRDPESLIASGEEKGRGRAFESPGIAVEGKGKGKELESQMDMCIESSAGTAAD